MRKKILEDAREGASVQRQNYTLPVSNEGTSVNSLGYLLKGMKHQSWTIYTAFVYRELQVWLEREVNHTRRSEGMWVTRIRREKREKEREHAVTTIEWTNNEKPAAENQTMLVRRLDDFYPAVAW